MVCPCVCGLVQEGLATFLSELIAVQQLVVRNQKTCAQTVGCGPQTVLRVAAGGTGAERWARQLAGDAGGARLPLQARGGRLGDDCSTTCMNLRSFIGTLTWRGIGPAILRGPSRSRRRSPRRAGARTPSAARASRTRQRHLKSSAAQGTARRWMSPCQGPCRAPALAARAGCRPCSPRRRRLRMPLKSMAPYNLCSSGKPEWSPTCWGWTR